MPNGYYDLSRLTDEDLARIVNNPYVYDTDNLKEFFNAAKNAQAVRAKNSGAKNVASNIGNVAAGVGGAADAASFIGNVAKNASAGGNAASEAAEAAADATKTPSAWKNIGDKWKTKGGKFFNETAPSWLDPDNIKWGKGTGLNIKGMPIGTISNVAGGVIQGADALMGIGDYVNSQADNDTLMSQIRTSAMGNPLLSNYLTSDQLNMLGAIQRDGYRDEAGLDDFFKGAVGGIGKAIPATLLGLATGGGVGAAIGGLGSLANSGIDALTTASGENTAELQALYQALQDAEMQYKSMKRPNFTGLGIQQRYQDMYA